MVVQCVLQCLLVLGARQAETFPFLFPFQLLHAQICSDSVISSTPKVFDVRLNGHVVVKDLDIFDRVGHSTAHDEIIPMSIKKGKLSVQGEVSTFTGKLHIEFVKVITLCWSEP